ncbi:sensor histidine kinase [Dactylosporangium darangshiense]|uniref:histidine kinase n=1 Tax=Dactylosporangium darangshiense TaxID=579108 RepID=A0ABP8DVZ6_9ACTN
MRLLKPAESSGTSGPVERFGPVVAGAVGAAFAATALLLPRSADALPTWADALVQPVGVTFLAIGLYVWIRQPEIWRMGLLLWAEGATWYLGDLQHSTSDLLFKIGFWFFHLHTAVLAHLLLASPFGRLKFRLESVAVVAAYGCVLVTQGMRILVEKDLHPQGWGDPHAQYSVWATIGSISAVLVIAAIVALAYRRWRGESPSERRARGMFWPNVSLIGVVLIGLAVAQMVHASVQIVAALLSAYAVSLLLLGLTTLVNAHRLQAAHRDVSKLLRQLQQNTDDNGGLRAAVAEALVDPSLTIHYRRADSGEYVDLHGVPAPLPPDTVDRRVTYVGPSDAPVAAIVHDSYLAEHPSQRSRLAAVVAAAELAITNANLRRRAEGRAHLRGMAEVEMQTRRTIGRELHDGLQHRLTALQVFVGRARSDPGPDSAAWLGQFEGLIQETIRELREVVQGVYPAVLPSQGLADALDALVGSSPVPLILSIEARRWPAKVEETAFFIISEAVGNAWKHARASRITVSAREQGQKLHVEVRDNGVGGAMLKERDGGLRGMQDRAAALQGSLEITTGQRQGTMVRLVLPCA